MSSQWKTLLQDHPPQADENAPGLCVLDNWGLIHAHGADARSFLQNQLSNDVNRLDQSGLYAALCNPKGRMLANFLIVPLGDGILLQLSADLSERTIAHLRKYVMRSKVVIDDAADDIARIGLIGDGAETLLQQQGFDIGTEDLAVDAKNGVSLVRLPGATARFEAFGSADAVTGLWQALAPQCRAASESQWAMEDIQAVIPWISDSSYEDVIPQMANLDVIDAVSFTKGCYPGQEIVARTHYLGKQKKRLFQGSVEGSSAKPGDLLYCPADRKAQSVGQVLQAVEDGDNSHFLAVCQMSSREMGGVHLGDVEGPVVVLNDPPYSLEPPEIDTRN